MKTSLKFMTAAIIGATFSIASNMAFADDGTVKTINGLKFQSCSIDEDGTNFCTKATADKMKAYAKKGAKFGNDSALFGMWDKTMNHKVYAAINKKTNKVFFYPRGLHAATGDDVIAKVTYDNNNSICTTGDNVSLVGDKDVQSFDDLHKEVDYCVEYSDTEGFGKINRVDAETREVLEVLSI
ncbi:hypothetical protein [Psychrobacter sp. AOP31-A1-22]|uniref:hypothetical protein n=1 Tax=Psychrobacter sp. AOP31-A1-22 TaxID=3457696 RepID=UPI004036B061